LKHLSLEELKAFTAENNLEYKENHCWARLKYEPINGAHHISGFFPKDMIEEQIKIHMEEAVKIRNGGKLTSPYLRNEIRIY
jgi:hypothetical protein